MSSINSTPNNERIRLNVGGKVFETTKNTLSTHPESSLARLANGNIPSEKDESGAFFIDRDYEHFSTILNYFRSGVVNLDRNEKAMKDILSEANFYNIQPLVDEIKKTMGSNHTEVITLYTSHATENANTDKAHGIICFSEAQDDYAVLQALRDRPQLQFKQTLNKGCYRIVGLALVNLLEIQTILRGFGFVQESYEADYDKFWKFILKPSTNRTEAITIYDAYKNGSRHSFNLLSNPQDDYEILRALRDRTQYNLVFANKGRYSFTYYGNIELETILCGFGFLRESYKVSFYVLFSDPGQVKLKCCKYVRTVSK